MKDCTGKNDNPRLSSPNNLFSPSNFPPTNKPRMQKDIQVSLAGKRDNPSPAGRIYGCCLCRSHSASSLHGHRVVVAVHLLTPRLLETLGARRLPEFRAGWWREHMRGAVQEHFRV